MRVVFVLSIATPSPWACNVAAKWPKFEHSNSSRWVIEAVKKQTAPNQSRFASGNFTFERHWHSKPFRGIFSVASSVPIIRPFVEPDDTDKCFLSLIALANWFRKLFASFFRRRKSWFQLSRKFPTRRGLWSSKENLNVKVFPSSHQRTKRFVLGTRKSIRNCVLKATA